MARAPVEPNCSKQVSQMLFTVRDWVAERALVCLGEGAETDREGLGDAALELAPSDVLDNTETLTLIIKN